MAVPRATEPSGFDEHVQVQLAVSLDGFVAGPDQSEENPLGVGGMELHEWAFKLEAWPKQHGE